MVCWTPDGAESESECTAKTGGTATAIRLASRRGIPVFNLRGAGAIDRIKALLDELVKDPNNRTPQMELL